MVGQTPSRTKAVEHLRSWVDHVYRPHYGHLAVMLAPCWDRHELCLVHLDWLTELHSYLYFNKRTAAAPDRSGRVQHPHSAGHRRANPRRDRKCAHRRTRRERQQLARCPVSTDSTDSETQDYLDLIREAHAAGRAEAEREMADRWNDIARPVTSGALASASLRSGAGGQAAGSTSATRGRTTTKAAR